MTNTGLLILAVILAVPVSATERGASETKRLRECEADSRPATPPKDWQRVGQREGFAFFLPASCVPDAEARRFVHGGASWNCGTIGVDIVWGMWGPGSFSDQEQQCKTTLSGLPALVSIRVDGKARRRLVWYLTGHVHEPMVSAWSSVPEDAPVLQSITSSGVLAGERGPNRHSLK